MDCGLNCKTLQDTSLILNREAENLKGEAVQADNKVQHLRQITERLDQIEAGGAGLTLKQLHQIYTELQYQFPEEYVMYDLPAVALTQVTRNTFLSSPPPYA